jgi:hypothetical protein
MKPQIKIVFVALVVMFAAGISVAGESLQQFGEKKGRSYHADLYDGNSCDSCHDNANPESFPKDFVCAECHDIDELVQSTSRSDDEKWQNPHNNMHYGQDIPCMECHGEHQVNKPLCAGCHSFKYPKYKK